MKQEKDVSSSGMVVVFSIQKVHNLQVKRTLLMTER